MSASNDKASQYNKREIDTSTAEQQGRIDSGNRGSSANPQSNIPISTKMKEDPELKRFLDTLDKNLGSSEFYDIPVQPKSDEVAVGYVILPISPERITITDTRKSFPIGGLRTNTEALIRSGRGELTITLDVVFPDIDSINNKFREILAIFRACPFTTLKNTHIAENVTRKTVSDMDSVREKDLRDKLAFLGREVRKELTTLIDWYRKEKQTDPELTAKLTQLVELMERIATGKLIGVTIAELTSSMLSVYVERQNFGTPPRDITNRLLKIRALGAEIMEAYSTLNGLVNLRHRNYSDIVPVAFSSIQYGPVISQKGTVINSIRARMEFIVFHYAPMSLSYHFRDAKGDPTEDIGKCIYLRNYVKERFLTGGMSIPGAIAPDKFTTEGDHPHSLFNPDYTTVVGFRFPTTQLERVTSTDTEDSKLNPVREVITAANRTIFPHKFTVPVVEYPEANYINLYEDMVFSNNQQVVKGDPGIVIDNITVLLENKLAYQPIQGSLYGIYQFLGGTNAQIALSLSIAPGFDSIGKTKEEVYTNIIRKITYMKLESEQVALKNSRIRRHHKVFFSHPMTAMAGIYAVQVQNFRVTSPPADREGGPLQTNITMEMVEFRISQESREAVVAEQAASEAEMRLALGFAVDKYKRNLGEFSAFSSAREELDDTRPEYRILKKVGFFSPDYSVRDALRAMLFGSPQVALSDVSIRSVDDIITILYQRDRETTKRFMEVLTPEFFRKQLKNKRFRLPTVDDMDGNLASHLLDRAYFGSSVKRQIRRANDYLFNRKALTIESMMDKLGTTFIDSFRSITESKDTKIIRAKYPKYGKLLYYGGAARGPEAELWRQRAGHIFWTKKAMQFEATVQELATRLSDTSEFALAGDDGILKPSIVEKVLNKREPGLLDDSVNKILTQFPDDFTTNDAKRRTKAQAVVKALTRVWATHPSEEEFVSYEELKRFKTVQALFERVDYSSSQFISDFLDLIFSISYVNDPVISSNSYRELASLPHSLDPADDIRYKLITLSRWLARHSDEYRTRLASLHKAERDRSAYPDLNLPTYEEVLTPVMETIKNLYMSTTDFPRDWTLKNLPPEVYKWVSRLFPTYKDLGLIPPDDRQSYDIARGPKDIIEPDFFWYHFRINDFVEQALTNFKNAINECERPKITVKQEDADNKNYDDGDKAATVFDRYPNDAYGANYSSSKLQANTKAMLSDSSLKLPRGFTDPKQTVKFPVMLASENNDHLDYRSMAVDASNEFFVTHGLTKAMINRIMDEQADGRYRMIGAYPTFQLYFIEQDDETWTLLDDVFGYNAVVEIHIQKHKYRPWVADITLVNISRSLDETMSNQIATKNFMYKDPGWFFKTASAVAAAFKEERNLTDVLKDNYGSKNAEDAMREMMRRNYPSADVEPFSGERTDPGHFFLGVGSMIAIKMGYNTKPSEMEVVFTGQVAEIEHGDMIRIIAQDYSTQLTVPVDKTVTSGFIITTQAEAPKVIAEVVDKSPTHHYGTKDMFSAFAKLYGLTNVASYEVEGQGLRVTLDRGQVTPFSEAKELIDILVGSTNSRIRYTRKLENVYYPEGSILGKLLALGESWVIPHKTGLEVLHELCRHHPGWVYATRPYDLNGATLFFGKPSMPYFYTSWNRVTNNDSEARTKRSKSALSMRSYSLTLRDGFAKSKWGLMWAGMAATLADPEVAEFLINATNPPGYKYRFKEFYKYVRNVAPQLLTIAEAGSSAEFELKRLTSVVGEGFVRQLVQDYFDGKLIDQTLSNLGDLAHMEAMLPDTWMADYQKKKAEYEKKVKEAIQLPGQDTPNGKNKVGPVMINVDTLQDYLLDASKERTWWYSSRFIKAGTILVSLPDWYFKVRQITTIPIRTTDAYNTIYYGTLSTEEFPDQVYHISKDDGTPNEEGITTSQWSEARGVITAYMMGWRVFIWCFYEYLMSGYNEGTFNESIMESLIVTSAEADETKLPSRMRPFQRYHIADSTWNIINNGIYASSDQVDNVITVEFPKGGAVSTESIASMGGHEVKMTQYGSNDNFDAITIPFDMSIPREERRVRAVVEMNASNRMSAEMCAYSNLADAIRPMYRGDLMMRGNEKINPWDVVYINDMYNNMNGPVEVETVTHHFTKDTGFVTIITPHLLAVLNSDNAWLQCKAMGLVAGLLTIGGLGALSLSAYIPYVGPTLAISTILATTLLADSWTESSYGTSLFGLIMGKAVAFDRVHPVDILPLHVNGIPYVAGLRKKVRLTFAMQMATRWSNITRSIDNLEGKFANMDAALLNANLKSQDTLR